MPIHQAAPVRDSDRIDVTHDFAMCAWARHFNVSENDVRAAVAIVGDKAIRVKEHLSASGRGGSGPQRERPSAD